MAAIVYLIPFAFCLILSVPLGHHGEWTDYLWLVVAGEATAGGLHILFYYLQTHSTEYLGSLVKSVHHEEAWTELVPRTVTRRDSRGNTYTTVQTVEQRHPEQYYFHTTRGSRIECDARFFSHVLGCWGLRPQPDAWRDRRIKGGVRYGSHRSMDFYRECPLADDPRWVSVTEKHKYKNKIRNSNSIFRFRTITRKEAARLCLFDYPAINGHDAPCILSDSFTVTLSQQAKFRRFNGAFAPVRQMRLFILIFNAETSTAAISEYQREYWQGGNKNELVVCLGVDSGGKVKWARAFSWADSQHLEAEITEWMLRNSRLDLDAFHSWLLGHYRSWQRKEFSDFKYIIVPLQGWQIGMMILGCTAICTIALKLILQ